jgi:hypothetical protein
LFRETGQDTREPIWEVFLLSWSQIPRFKGQLPSATCHKPNSLYSSEVILVVFLFPHARIFILGLTKSWVHGGKRGRDQENIRNKTKLCTTAIFLSWPKKKRPALHKQPFPAKLCPFFLNLYVMWFLLRWFYFMRL